ncbi:glycine zipper 2TM domain-containing protein [Vibrio sp. WJH972]
MRRLLIILLLLPLYANAGYERNVARPVDKVEFAVVDSLRYITQTEVIKAREHGLETFIGAVTGAVIGSHFGRGHGKQFAIIAGSIAGANIARNGARANADSHVIYQDSEIVDLLLRMSDGSLIDVVQDVDPSMLFNIGDEVRILYFGNEVRVDKVF